MLCLVFVSTILILLCKSVFFVKILKAVCRDASQTAFNGFLLLSLANVFDIAHDFLC